MPKIPTIAVAGLWSAITVAALSVVAGEQSPPTGSAEASAFSAAASTADPTYSALIILTDATGNRYRMRQD